MSADADNRSFRPEAQEPLRGPLMPSQGGPDDSPGGPGSDPESSGSSLEGLDFVMDVPVELTVEIGRRKLRIADILRLGAGAVLELDKAAGEPLDIYINNRPVARGEAVVVGDRYGIRLTEVLLDEHRARLGALK